MASFWSLFWRLNGQAVDQPPGNDMPTVAFHPRLAMNTSPLSEQAAESIATTFQLLGIQPPQVHLTRVMKAIQVCLLAGMGDSARLKSHFSVHRERLDAALAECNRTAPIDARLTHTASDTLKFFLRPMEARDQRVTTAAGNFIMCTLLRQEPMHKARLSKLLVLHRALEKQPALSPEQNDQLDKLFKDSTSQLLALLDLKESSKSDHSFLTGARMCSHLRGTIYSDHPAQQQAADGRMFLVGDLLSQRIAEHLELVEEGQWESLTTLIAMATGLPWNIAQDMPLAHGAHQSDGMFWLDVGQGVLFVDLKPVLRDLGQAVPGAHPNRSLLRLCLPLKLSGLLRQAIHDCPQTAKLGDLHAAGQRSEARDFNQRSDRATLIRSMGAHAARKSEQRAVAAYAFLSFELMDASDLHYIALPESLIWNLRSEVFEDLGLGPSERMDESGEYVGSKRCLTADSACTIFDERRTLVDTHRVQRRSSIQALITFHNMYASYVALFLQFVSGARRTSRINFLASSWFSKSIFGYIDDKDVGIAGGRTPVHISPMTHFQLQLWEAHLQSLSMRLETLLGTRAKAAVARIHSILDKREVNALFFLSGEATPEEITADAIFFDRAQPINRDFGRHFFASELCISGETLADVQGFLRHQGNHINSQCSLGHETHQGRMHRLCQACDKITTRTGVFAVKGLSKGSK